MGMMIQPKRFSAGGGGGASSTKWRIRCPQTYLNSNNSLGFTNVEMFTTVGGADETASGCTMTASATFSSFAPSNTTDSSLSTLWTTGNNTAPGGGHWLQAEFTSAKAIAYINIRVRDDGFREDPKELYIEYWDGAAWQIAISAPATIPVWWNGETRTYVTTAFASPGFGAHRYWRVNVPTANADGLVIITEMELRETVSGVDATGSGTASGTVGNFAEPGEGVTKLFDNNNSTQWQPAVPAQVTYDFGVGVTKEISELLVVQNGSFNGRTPATLNVQYSDDNSTWTTAGTFAPGNTWAGGSKVFRLIASPTASAGAYSV